MSASCYPNNDDGATSAVIERIQERLNSKNYAAIEGMAEFQHISKLQRGDEKGYTVRKTGAGVIVGIALVAVGFLLYQVGGYAVGETIAYIGAAVFTVSFLHEWGQQ